MVTPALAQRRSWPKVLPWFVGFSVLGGLASWLGLAGLWTTVRAMAAGMPLVSFRPRDTMAAPLALTFFALAVNALIVGATLTADGRPRTEGAGVKWIKTLVGVGLLGAGLAVFAPSISESLVAAAAERSGYERCPQPPMIAHAPAQEWARPGSTAKCARLRI